MKGRYLYQVGDDVHHRYYPELKGTITQIGSHQPNSDDWSDGLDPNNPVYKIKWNDNTEGVETEPQLHPY